MYCPIMRGKQNELIALRDLAPIVSPLHFKPIIEPVRENLPPLIKTIKELNDNDITPFIIINPDLGDFADNPQVLIQPIKNECSDLEFIPCIKVTGDAAQYEGIIKALSQEYAIYAYDNLDKRNIKYLIDADYAIINKSSSDAAKNYLQERDVKVIIIDDPFQKEKRNADYAIKSFFSDLHVAYKTNKNIYGFSDYTIVGESYSEGGGPAYVITIHLSYIDTDEFDSMYIRHFSSENDGTPSNPGGKFIQALNNVITLINADPNIFDNTTGIDELRSLHRKTHYPGLGTVKKISMKHHIETICKYLSQ